MVAADLRNVETCQENTGKKSGTEEKKLEEHVATNLVKWQQVTWLHPQNNVQDTFAKTLNIP